MFKILREIIFKFTVIYNSGCIFTQNETKQFLLLNYQNYFLRRK